MSTHKSNAGPVLTFYRVRLSRPLLAGPGTIPGVAPWSRTTRRLAPQDLHPLASSLSCQTQPSLPWQDTFAHHASPAHLHGGLLRGHVRQEEPLRVPVQPDGQDVDACEAPQQRWQCLEHPLKESFQLHGWQGVFQEREH